MEDEDYQYEAPELPEPGPGNSLEEVTEFYRKVDQKLDNLQHETQKIYKDQENPWTTRFQAVRPKDTEREHIIGIIGATGAGKSAIINSTLNVILLSPTSSMQACTSAVIEIAYNRCSMHECRATVEFVPRSLWHAEVSTFLRCFAGLPQEDFEDDGCEAAIALAKMKAVYPSLDKDSFTQFTVDELVGQPGLRMLSTSENYNAATCDALYKKIHKYIESRETQQHYINRNNEAIEREMEYWPLVRKVRIFVKAPILKTGCVIVDLPGTFENNPARAAIAKDYLARCASIWIVVPLVRAVDDKVARTLLNESLRNQLKRDGTLERVVLVCSKADQGLLNELKGKFKTNKTLQDRLAEFADNRKQLKEKEKGTSVKIKEVNATVQDTSNKIAHLELELDAYKQLLQLAQAGQAVHPPILKQSKRRVMANESSSRKQLKLDKRSISALIDMHVGSGDNSALTEHDSVTTIQNNRMNHVKQDRTQPPMETTELQTKVEDIGGSLHTLHKDLETRTTTLDHERRRFEAIKELIILVDDREWCAYYEARNKYVRAQLQADFRSGVRELERAELEAKFGVHPTSNGVNKVKQQPDLPVFCVSSQGFQKLSGRLQGEKVSGKFTDINQTGIPDLMRYCMTIGEKHIVARRAACLNLISQLLTSLKFWLAQQSGSNSDVGQVLSPASQSIDSVTEKLIKDIDQIFQSSITKIDAETDHVNRGLKKAASAGEQQALGIIQSWGTPPYALHPSTYRAVLRHGGLFRDHNWIEELLAPMMAIVDVYWNRAFNRAIPKALRDAKKQCAELVRDFLSSLEQMDHFICVPQQAGTMFKDQFERLKAALETVLDVAGYTISQIQMQANRLFKANATSTLEPFFRELLASDRGPGVIQRYQQKIQAHVKRHLQFMFSTAVLQVTLMLRHSREDYRQPMLRCLQEYSNAIRQDCQNLFATQTSNQPSTSRPRKDNVSKVVAEFEAFLAGATHTTGSDTAPSSNTTAADDLAGLYGFEEEPTIKTERSS